MNVASEIEATDEMFVEVREDTADNIPTSRPNTQSRGKLTEGDWLMKRASEHKKKRLPKREREKKIISGDKEGGMI